MGFYEELAGYYDYIFPVGKAQVDFIADAAGKPPKALLDVACGTGGYALEFAKLGYSVTAVDLDAGMIEGLRAKAAAGNIEVKALEANMLDLDQKLSSKYDLAFCIGNSLVHLNDEKEIERFLEGIKSLLVQDGSLIIQIINYDRVLAKNIQSLPTIENKEMGLEFQRFYRYEKNSHKIYFKTVLEVGGNTMVNEIPLYPITSEEMIRLLGNAGFREIRLFGDFRRAGYDKEGSYSLVLTAS